MKIPKGYSEDVRQRRTDKTCLTEKREKDKQSIANKTNDCATRNLLKTGSQLM